MILVRMILIVMLILFVAWLIGGLTRDRTRRRRRR
jgi:hypothetical protein